MLVVLAAMSLPHLTAPAGDRTAIQMDTLPALLLVIPIFVITLVMGDFFVVKIMSGGQSSSAVYAMWNEIAMLQYPSAAASATSPPAASLRRWPRASGGPGRISRTL